MPVMNEQNEENRAK